LRIAGGASILAGLLMIAGFILHPAGEDATVFLKWKETSEKSAKPAAINAFRFEKVLRILSVSSPLTRDQQL
jgi:hypothetical protein